MEECGGVSIKFPAEGSNSDKIIIRGPKDDADKAKKQLLQLANEKVLVMMSESFLSCGKMSDLLMQLFAYISALAYQLCFLIGVHQHQFLPRFSLLYELLTAIS